MNKFNFRIFLHLFKAKSRGIARNNFLRGSERDSNFIGYASGLDIHKISYKYVKHSNNEKLTIKI